MFEYDPVKHSSCTFPLGAVRVIGLFGCGLLPFLSTWISLSEFTIFDELYLKFRWEKIIKVQILITHWSKVHIQWIFYDILVHSNCAIDGVFWLNEAARTVELFSVDIRNTLRRIFFTL